MTDQPADISSVPPPSSRGRALLPLGIGLAVALAIYIVAKAIEPDPTSGLFGKSGADTFPLKSALSSGVLALAAFQLYIALWIFGKVNRKRAQPKWLGRIHRASGIAALVLSLPIAYNCLLTYGFADYDRRVAVHATAGCFFYGVFAAKIVIVRSKRLPGWMLPATGGTLIATIFVLWYSAALWYYNDFDSPGLSPKVEAASAPAGGSGYAAPAGGSGGGTSAGSAAPAKGTVVEVTYKDFAIDPEAITVHVGQKIKWTNQDGAVHNVITQEGEKIKSPDFDKGQAFTFAPTKEGAIKYLCTFHASSMVGTITVVK